MANIIPEKLTKCEVYADNDRLLGIADGTFPSLEFMTSEVKGSGLVGTIDSPGKGGLGSITVTLNWRTTRKDFMNLAEPRGHILDLYSQLLDMDAGSGEYVSHQFHIFLKAFTKKLEFGSMVNFDVQGASTEHECYYLKMSYDGREIIELDKYNYIFKVNGTDYLEDMRHQLAIN